MCDGVGDVRIGHVAEDAAQQQDINWQCATKHARVTCVSHDDFHIDACFARVLFGSGGQYR